jgi:hypothetical protein
VRSVSRAWRVWLAGRCHPLLSLSAVAILVVCGGVAHATPMRAELAGVELTPTGRRQIYKCHIDGVLGVDRVAVYAEDEVCQADAGCTQRASHERSCDGMVTELTTTYYDVVVNCQGGACHIHGFPGPYLPTAERIAFGPDGTPHVTPASWHEGLVAHVGARLLFYGLVVVLCAAGARLLRSAHWSRWLLCSATMAALLATFVSGRLLLVPAAVVGTIASTIVLWSHRGRSR